MSDTVQALADENPLVVDASRYHLIDDKTRALIKPEDENEKILGVETDKDAVRRYFKCPKIVGDNIDLSQCQLYVGYIGAKDEKGQLFFDEEPGRYHCDDVMEDGDYLLFSWKLSGNVFLRDGYVAYNIYAVSNNGDEAVMAWNTTPAIGRVLKTVPKGKDIVERFPDVINQLFERLLALEAKIGTGGGTSFSGSAADVTYNNEKSKLDAENVQDAIDKLSEKVEKLEEEEYDIVHLYLSEDMGAWSGMEEEFYFNLPKPLYGGKEYTITIDGKEYTAVAKTGNYYDLYEGIILSVDGVFDLVYNKNGLIEEYNTVLNYTWENKDYDDEGLTIWKPVNLTINYGKAESEDNGYHLYLTEDVGDWSGIEGIFFFNIPEPLRDGKEYSVTIDGETYVVIAKSGSYDLYEGLILSANGVFDLVYNANGLEEGYNTALSVYWELERDENDTPIWKPIDFNIDYGELDAESIIEQLPKIEMVATFADGTTKTFALYGEVVE